MSETVTLQPTTCAICSTPENCEEVYPANFDMAAFNPQIFSARRLPDRIHYRLVRCRSCGLLRSDPVADAEALSRLYARSEQTYDRELIYLKHTYGRYLARLEKLGGRKGSLIEIGCGNGFVLEEALAQGYAEAWGVEPSSQAVEKASPVLRERIVCDIFRPGLFPAERFDTVAMFQVFDHLPDPAMVLEECFRILKPGGMILGLNHNAAAFSARLMGERSPIVDIEHTYLYTPDTMTKIFTRHGFRVAARGAVFNEYSLQYLTQLVHLPARIKPGALSFLKSSGIGRIRFNVPLGNMFVIGQKPSNAQPQG
jgi:SAM-dependent methyltransferase